MNTSTPARVDVALGDRGYPVLVGRGWLGDLAAHVPLPPRAHRVLLVTQQPVVDAGHVDAVEDALTASGVTVARHVVVDGETAKDTGVLRELWRAAAHAGLTRDDLVVAVGGGVVGDLAGFAAATYNRGVAVLQVPTTLLGQVDAAIGGKTGVNLPEGKNLVGAFHQPIAVACDVSVLATLPERIRVEGLAEVIKYGLIRDPSILATIESVPDAVREGEPDVVTELVVRCVRVKAIVVAGDELEQGQRAHLNLGHTYGHVVEALTGYEQVLHGEAVAMGTSVALRLGVRLGHTPQQVVDRAEKLLRRVGLPTVPPALDRSAVWSVMTRDKKASGDGVRFVILDDVARPRVITPSRADVDAVIDDVEAG